jgi:hypothetical protein
MALTPEGIGRFTKCVMDQTAPAPEEYKHSRGMGPRKPRPRDEPNPLREWLEQVPPPMSKSAFAKAIGCTSSYISMLLADTAPWPNKEMAQRIAKVTKGAVTPNKLIGYRRRKPGV